MKIGTKILILILTLNLLSCKGSAQKTETEKQTPKFVLSQTENNSFPKPIGYINDYELIFTDKQKEELNKIITEFENRTSNEIAILTIESIEPYTSFKTYLDDLSNEWGIGKVGKNNGLAIGFSKNLKMIAISTGIGTEKKLTNYTCQEVIDKNMIPNFLNKDYFGATKNGLLELINKWE